MQKLLLLAICIILSMSILIAAPKAKPAAVAGNEVKYTGTIVDNLCASGHKKDLKEFVKVHPKSCAMMPSCQASGYSLYTKDKLLPIDKKSNELVVKYLKGKKATLNVLVKAKKAKGPLQILEIKPTK